MGAARIASERLRAGIEPRRIVVIGASESFVGTFRRLLEVLGHSVTTATDGCAGVELVKEIQPDVVLSSIELAGLNGFQVADAIRAALPNKPLLVAHSSYSKLEIAERARAAGFDRYLAKPATLEAINKVIASIDDSAICANLLFDT